MDAKITEALTIITHAMEDVRPPASGLTPVMSIVQEEKLWLTLRIVRRLLTEHQVQALADGARAAQHGDGGR